MRALKASFSVSLPLITSAVMSGVALADADSRITDLPSTGTHMYEGAIQEVTGYLLDDSAVCRCPGSQQLQHPTAGLAHPLELIMLRRQT
jgi:hypothetical protein